MYWTILIVARPSDLAILRGRREEAEIDLKPLLRLALTLGAAIVMSLYRPSQYMAWSMVGGLMIASARCLGRDVRGVPAIDLLLPLSIIVLFSKMALYHGYRLVFDEYLLAIDQTLGFGWILGRVFVACPVWAFICNVAYRIVPLGVAVLYLAIDRPIDRVRLCASIVIASVLCYVTYGICPAVGPVHVFAGWPLHEPHVTPVLITMDGPPNCMPSGHFLWAILLLLFSWRCRWPMRTAFLVFNILTIGATLGLGEHYWIDLLASIPYAAGIYYLLHIRCRFVERRFAAEEARHSRCTADG